MSVENNKVSRRHLGIYGVLLSSLVIPFAMTLSTVHKTMTPPSFMDNPSPYGYTMSLLIFVVPILYFVVWLCKNPQYRIERNAFIGSVAGVFVLGSFLDFVFGYSFFYFPNRGAVLGLYLPSFSFSEWRWIPHYLPIEEFGFYLLGSTYMLASYLWGVLFWFKRYNHADHQKACLSVDRMLKVSYPLFFLGISLFILGLVIKHLGPYPDGFPGYFTFMIFMMFLPCIFLFESLRFLINWRAFTFMSFVLLLVSIVYEATLGVPYGWWKYHNDQMLGILIHAWSDLPIEAVCLWVAAGFGTVLLFEALRYYFYIGKPILRAFLGDK
ncbi:MAG: hypothetical protein AB8C84_02080 [Oligoflexales bacterium]